MKRLIAVLSCVVFIAACFLFPGNDFLTEESTAPPVEDTDAGTVTINTAEFDTRYTVVGNNVVNTENNEANNDTGTQLVCEVDEVVFVQGPYEIKPAVQFIYKNFDGLYSNVDFYQRRLRYEYVFLKEVKATALSGDDFRFVAWVKGWLVSPHLEEDVLMVWGGPFTKEEYVTDLFVKGDFDIAPFTYDDDLKVRWEVRGRSPNSRTFIQVEATLLGLYFCEE